MVTKLAFALVEIPWVEHVSGWAVPPCSRPFIISLLWILCLKSISEMQYKSKLIIRPMAGWDAIRNYVQVHLKVYTKHYVFRAELSDIKTGLCQSYLWPCWTTLTSETLRCRSSIRVNYQCVGCKGLHLSILFSKTSNRGSYGLPWSSISVQFCSACTSNICKLQVQSFVCSLWSL